MIHAVKAVMHHALVGRRSVLDGRGRRDAVVDHGEQQQGGQRLESASHANRLRQTRRRCKTGRAGGLSGGLRQSEP
jgi:hypothetical protein